MNIASKIIRVLTIPPIIAFLMVVILFQAMGNDFGTMRDFILALVFLVLLPALGYPLQRIIPFFKEKGREGQRLLAMIHAVLGYIFGTVYAFCIGAMPLFRIIFLTYLLSGIQIMLFNKVFQLKASGHACGVTAPFIVLSTLSKYFLGVGIVLIIFVYASSLKIKRHSIGQLIGGSTISIVSYLVSSFMVGII